MYKKIKTTYLFLILISFSTQASNLFDYIPNSNSKRKVKLRQVSSLSCGVTLLASLISKTTKNQQISSKREVALGLSTIYLFLLAWMGQSKNYRNRYEDLPQGYDPQRLGYVPQVNYAIAVMTSSSIGALIGMGQYVNSRESSDNFLIELIDFGKMIGYGALGGLAGLSIYPADHLLAKIGI